jgi:transposase
MFLEHMNISEISKKLETSYENVKKWTKKFEMVGDVNKKLKKLGRKKN